MADLVNTVSDIDINDIDTPLQEDAIGELELNVRKKIVDAYQKGDTKLVCKLIEKNTFQNGVDLIDIWDQVHYLQEEKRLGKSLTPLIRFRVRKRNPPPHSICPNGERKTASLPKRATKILKEWLLGHSEDPYPSNKEKEYLSELSGLTATQVKTWFANARRRIHRNQDTNSRKRSMYLKNLQIETLQNRKPRRLPSFGNEPLQIPALGQTPPDSYLKSPVERRRFIPPMLGGIGTDYNEPFIKQFHHNQNLPQDVDSRAWFSQSMKLPISDHHLSFSDHHWQMEYLGSDLHSHLLGGLDTNHPTTFYNYLPQSGCAQSSTFFMPPTSTRRYPRTSLEEAAKKQSQLLNLHSLSKREGLPPWNDQITDFDAYRRSGMKPYGRLQRGYMQDAEHERMQNRRQGEWASTFRDDSISHGWPLYTSGLSYPAASSIANTSTDPLFPSRCNPSDIFHGQPGYVGHTVPFLERRLDDNGNRDWSSGRADMDAAKILADLSSCPH